MPKLFPRKQVRRCTGCQKVGHNKSTCPDTKHTHVAPTYAHVTAKAARAPLRFFVHHVAAEPSHSPHLLNLKENSHPGLHHVHAEAPSQDHNPVVAHLPPEPAPAPKKVFSIDDLIGAEEPTIPALLKSTPAQDAPAEDLFSKLPPPPESLSDTEVQEVVIEETVPNKWTEPIEKEGFIISLQEYGAFLHTLFHPRRTVLAGAMVVVLLTSLFMPSWALGYYRTLQTVKTSLLENSTEGFTALQDATVAMRSANIAEAATATDRALDNFSTALQTLDKHTVLQTIASIVPVVRGSVMSRQKVLLAGDSLALGNKALIVGITTLAATPSTTPAEKIAFMRSALAQSLPHYQDAKKLLADVDISTLPPEYQATFSDFRSLLSAAVDDFVSLHDIATHFQEIFGGNGLRRYLIVFQNEHELRPTGGFLGSYALIDVRDGKIVNLTVPPQGSYDVQGQLSVFEKPPTPLTLSNNRWEFQDANWFPDFPTSAEQIMWMYRKARGVTVDGVIAVNGNVLTRLLKIFGPVADANRGIMLSEDNALKTIQSLVEKSSDKDNGTPKQIVTDLAPAMLERFSNLDAQYALPLLATIGEALREKEVQLYFTDPALEAAMRSYGWAGHITHTDANQDYLAVFNTNIGGQKSDEALTQQVEHEAVVQSDGSIIDTVTITRTHTGSADTAHYGAVNTDYVRIYVPEGSELLSAKGFGWPAERSFLIPEDRFVTDERLARTEKEIAVDNESGTRITTEYGKTAFGNWMIVEPGHTAKAVVRYRLPFTIDTLAHDQRSNPLWSSIIRTLDAPIADYRIVLQKQSGITSRFSTHIIFPDTWHPIWKEGEELALVKNGATMNPIDLTTDRLFGILMEPDTH